MIQLDHVDIGFDEAMFIDRVIQAECSLGEYRLKVFLDRFSLIYLLGNLIYIYYIISRVIDPPPCCQYNGKDFFAYTIDAGFIMFLVGGGTALIKKWFATAEEHREIMASARRAHPIKASGKVWRVFLSLNEACFCVELDTGVIVFLDDVSGGTRILDIVFEANDPREPLIADPVKPRDWRWRQFPRTSTRSHVTTAGPMVELRTYGVYSEDARERLFSLADTAYRLAAYDLALFPDPPAILEAQIAALADRGPHPGDMAAE